MKHRSTLGMLACSRIPHSGALRRAWAFVMVLSYSRHQYVEFVFDQRLPTWIALHAHAFAFFGGVPGRVVLDNLKAGITRACFDDPQIQPTYRECAEHYGFLLAPCAPRTPEHKGKVEQGGVHYVKQNFLGGRAPTTLTQANADVLEWCRTTAGLRRHGTTKVAPLERFEQVERTQLLPLPATPYELAIWKRVKLHRDGYVVFNDAFYSAPSRLVGQTLWVRGGSEQVRLYTSDSCLGLHPSCRPAARRPLHPSGPSAARQSAGRAVDPGDLPGLSRRGGSSDHRAREHPLGRPGRGPASAGHSGPAAPLPGRRRPAGSGVCAGRPVRRSALHDPQAHPRAGS